MARGIGKRIGLLSFGLLGGATYLTFTSLPPKYLLLCATASVWCLLLALLVTIARRA